MAQLILTPVLAQPTSGYDRERVIFVDLAKITHGYRVKLNGVTLWKLYFENDVHFYVKDLGGAPDLRPPTDRNPIVLTTSTSGALWVNGNVQKPDAPPVPAPLCNEPDE